MEFTKEDFIEILQGAIREHNATSPIGEAEFVCFPSPTGLLVHTASGVAFNPTWRGTEALSVLNIAISDLSICLDNGWQLNPAAMPRRTSEPSAPPQPSTTSVTANHATGYAQFPAGYTWQPTSDDEIKITLKVHQDGLNKKESTASQIARYVAGVKVGSYEGKRVMTFVNKAGDAIFAPMWEDPSAEAWKSPFDKGKGWSSEFMETANALALERFKGIIRFNGICSFKMNEEGKKDKNGLLYASFYKVLSSIEGWQVIE